jgi:hypothetical protein
MQPRDALDDDREARVVLGVRFGVDQVREADALP